MWGWESFFLRLRSFLETSSREIESASKDYSYFVLERLHLAVRNLSHVRNVLAVPDTRVQFSDDEHGALREYCTSISELLGVLSSYSLQWEHHIDYLHATNNAYSVAASVSRGRGQPRFEINRDQLKYLSSLNFTWTEISSMLGVSRMTVYRRHQEFGLLDVGERISNGDPRSLLLEMRTDQPDMGEVLVWGRIRAMGFTVQHGIRETDPLNVALRGLLGSSARRPYSVPGPNSLWHIGMFMCNLMLF